MLIGVGFHSALECLQGTLYYLGQNVSEFYEQLAKEKARKSQGIPVKDAVLLFAHGAATDLLFEIFMDETDSSSRSRYRAPESVARRNSWG